MKKFFATSRYFILMTLTALSLAGVVLAGQLTPGAPVGGTFYTLTNIYTRLTTNGASTEGAAWSSPTAAPAGTHYTLTQLYNLIPVIDPATVKNSASMLGVAGTYPSLSTSLAGDTAATDASAADICLGKEAWARDGTLMTGTNAITASKLLVSTTYCGVEGTVLKNLFNGSGTDKSGVSYAGGGLANGGIDDSAYSGAPTDRYQVTWTLCTSENNYCGTGLAGAHAKDESTGLVWSYPCKGVGCSTFVATQSDGYSWDTSMTNNNGKTALQLCSQGNHGQVGWELPTQKELLQMYVNGFYGNVGVTASSGIHNMSATTYSKDTNSIWNLNIATGHMYTPLKTMTDDHIRCVKRPT